MLRKILVPAFAAAMLSVSPVVSVHAEDVGANGVVQVCTVGRIDADACSTAADRYLASLATLPPAEFDSRLTELIVGLATGAETLPRNLCLLVPPTIRQHAAEYSDPALTAQANAIADSLCKTNIRTGAIGAPFSGA